MRHRAPPLTARIPSIEGQTMLRPEIHEDLWARYSPLDARGTHPPTQPLLEAPNSLQALRIAASDAEIGLTAEDGTW